MAWTLLVIAGVLECAWAVGLKYADGFSKPVPTLFSLLALVASVWLLSIAMKSIPIGTAYAVWTGIGAIGVAILGIFLFGESKELARLLFLVLIISGIIGLKWVSPS